jgi:hypothetical protein
MGILAFLAAAFLLLLPFRYVGNGEIYNLLPGLSLFGLILIVPGMILAALLGSRTYRAQRGRATAVGTAIGAIVGWTSFFSLSWLTSVIPPPPEAGELEAALGSSGLAETAALYAFIPLTLFATAMVLYGLYSVRAAFEQRERLVLIGAVATAVAGLAVLLTSFEYQELIGAAVATVAGAVAGRVSGGGYARAGGDDMIPPGSTIRPREPRRKAS